MPNCIILAGRPIYTQEVLASEAITPGHLIQYVPSGGDAGKVRKHATSGGDAMPMWALENLTPDRSSALVPIDVPWATGETVRFITTRAGDEVYAWVPANAAAIVKGDLLCSNGDGTVRKFTAQAANEGGTATYTVQSEAVVGIAAEALNNSAIAAPARIRVFSK